MAHIEKNQTEGEEELSNEQTKKIQGGGVGGANTPARIRVEAPKVSGGSPKLGGPVHLGGGENEWD